MADWNRVQGIQTNVGSGTTNSLAFASTVGVGNIVCGGILIANTASVTSITDDQSNAYSSIVTDASGSNLIVGYRSTGLLTNSPKTIIVTLSSSSGFIWMIQDEFSIPTGATSISSDGSAHIGNTASAATPNFTTANPDDLVYAVCQTSGTATTGAGFNAGTNSGGANVSEWAIQSSPSSTVNGTFATQTGTGWLIAFATSGGIPASTVLGAARMF